MTIRPTSLFKIDRGSVLILLIKAVVLVFFFLGDLGILLCLGSVVVFVRLTPMIVSIFLVVLRLAFRAGTGLIISSINFIDVQLIFI